ncbi:type III pantothenate kinase [Peptoniphilus equinus]|uniref:Type III pantothenate kinase n=1 Tax=Peptoniphilus equinus TaxID=3016343 RepID=A0ABY7QVR7_9FIRM|nr:type III pantothenate kinase [Peptoniphilus equinus]WBW50008.1 type III pantothenate kinase [Peptoniphilus equinus]
MIVAINIENNAVHFGLFYETLVHSFSFKRDSLDTVDELKKKIEIFMAPYTLACVKGCIIASVVPDMTYKLKMIFSDALVVGSGVRTGLNIKCENPKEVGADRIARAAYVAPDQAIVLSLKDVITVDFIEGNQFLGGMIMPGISLALESLKSMAKLSKVELEHPKSPIGNTTERSIQAGLYYQSRGAVASVLRDYPHHKLIATGEFAPFILHEFNGIAFIKDLDIQGLYKIYCLNKKSERV